jgi:hypothetical protein
MSEEVWIGYGDEECKSCKLIENQGMLKLCKAMVGYTQLQIKYAKEDNWTKAIEYEGFQNDTQGIIGCWPGFVRV